jgi:hypothetical protein
MTLKWMLDSVCLEIVLILMKHSCMVCAERTICSEIILDSMTVLLCDMGMRNLVLVHFEIVLVLVEDRCTICAKRIIGLKIILDTSNDTPRWRGSTRSSIQSVWRWCKS